MGNVLNTYHYDSTGIDYNVGERNPIRYRSYYFDNSIGFYYLQSRFYFSSMARFINADLPIYAQKQKDMSNGTNLFAYCNNDPVNYVDPDGRLRATLSYYKSQSWLFKFLSKYVGVVYDVERPFVKKGSEKNVQITMSSIIGYSYGALGLVTLSVSNTTLKKSFMGVSFSTNTKGGVFVGASFSFMKTKVGSFIGIEGKHLCYGVSVAHNLKSNGSTYYVAFKLSVKINLIFLTVLATVTKAVSLLCKPIAVMTKIIKRIMKSPAAVGGATVTLLRACSG